MFRVDPVHRSGQRLLLRGSKVAWRHCAADSRVQWRWRRQPAKDQSSSAGAEQLRDDKARRVNRANAGESIGSAARQRHGGIGKRGRRCEPVGGGDVGRHREGCNTWTAARTSDDDCDEAEGGDEFAPPLGATRSHMLLCEEHLIAEHQMSRRHAGERTDHLCADIWQHLGYRQVLLPGFG